MPCGPSSRAIDCASARRLAPGEETRIGRHLPDLLVDAGRRFGDAEADIRADIEHADFQRADLRLDLVDQSNRCLFLARIHPEGARLAAFRFNFSDEAVQRLEIAWTAADAGDEALPRESLRDGAAGGVTCADDEGSSLGHGGLSRFFSELTLLETCARCKEQG